MSIQILQGDCIEVMRTLDAGSVHCVVTSPPYWGLRDYGTASWEGGDADCDHEPDKRGSRFATPVSEKQASNSGSGSASQRDCPCGAVRVDSQLGLEPTPEEYVENMVAVFREVRRVLRDDGTVWLNLGDSYCGTGSKGDWADPKYEHGRNGQRVALNNRIQGLKSKDLVGIPWRVAFALQADGWWLRSDIIWAKPNPMPESVRDRPTRSHEYVFLLSKSKTYYYDADAIAEPAVAWGERDQTNGKYHNEGTGLTPHTGLTGKQSRVGKATYTGFNERYDFENPSPTRNIRSVWNIATQPFAEAHFATFPEALVKPCILAGSPEGGTVLDPFGGSGTVGVVAQKAGRSAILIDLNPDYVEMMNRRLAQRALPFGEPEVIPL